MPHHQKVIVLWPVLRGHVDFPHESDANRSKILSYLSVKELGSRQHPCDWPSESVLRGGFELSSIVSTVVDAATCRFASISFSVEDFFAVEDLFWRFLAIAFDFALILHSKLVKRHSWTSGFVLWKITNTYICIRVYYRPQHKYMWYSESDTDTILKTQEIQIVTTNNIPVYVVFVFSVYVWCKSGDMQFRKQILAFDDWEKWFWQSYNFFVFPGVYRCEMLAQTHIVNHINKKNQGANMNPT